MTMRYLAAIDLSEASLLALDTLRAIAGDQTGEVTLLHVVDLDLYTAGGSVPGIMEFAEERLGRESSRLEGCGLRVRGVRVEQGDATRTILRVAADEDADLVVMTNVGKGGRPGRLFGSTAEGVASAGTVPVLVERLGLIDTTAAADDRDDDTGTAAYCRLFEHGSFERVLCAVDLDHDPGPLLGLVGTLPGLDAVRVIHVVRDAESVDPARERLHALVEEVPIPADVETEVLVGAPAGTILQDAADWDATTVVIRPSGHGALHRAVWGSVARSVALHTESSVLFVPDAA